MSEVIVIRIDKIHEYLKRNTKLLLIDSKKVIKTEFLNFFFGELFNKSME